MQTEHGEGVGMTRRKQVGGVTRIKHAVCRKPGCLPTRPA
jgi:hypothetical protein